MEARRHQQPLLLCQALMASTLLLALVSLASAHGPHVHPLTPWVTSMQRMTVSPLPSMHLTTNCSVMDTPSTASGDGSNSRLHCNVSWSGVLYPDESDLVALYVPASADPRGTVPVQYTQAASSPQYLTSGAGWAV